jgi:hypothetical protein
MADLFSCYFIKFSFKVKDLHFKVKFWATLTKATRNEDLILGKALFAPWC